MPFEFLRKLVSLSAELSTTFAKPSESHLSVVAVGRRSLSPRSHLSYHSNVISFIDFSLHSKMHSLRHTAAGPGPPSRPPSPSGSVNVTASRPPSPSGSVTVAASEDSAVGPRRSKSLKGQPVKPDLPPNGASISLRHPPTITLTFTCSLHRLSYPFRCIERGRRFR